MADMLKMTFSEMDDLRGAFVQMASDLEKTKTDAMTLLSDIQSEMETTWTYKIKFYRFHANTAALAVDDIASTIGDSWQGDRYEIFAEDIYPTAQSCMQGIKGNLENFEISISDAYQNFSDEITPLFDTLEKGKEDCEEIAEWIRAYTVQHMGLEKGYTEEQIELLQQNVKNVDSSVSTEECFTYTTSLLNAAAAYYNETGNKYNGWNIDGLQEYFSQNDYKKQGSTYMYNVQAKQNEDGSMDLSFTLSNSTKCVTEITIYDANGNVVSQSFMEGYEEPSSIADGFIGFYEGTKDMFEGEFAKYYGDFSNSKQDYSLHIPAGGYMRITDDISLMNTEAYTEESSAKKNIGSAVGVASSLGSAAAKATGNDAAALAFDVTADTVNQIGQDIYSGEFSGKTTYNETLAKTEVNEAIDTLSDFMGPAGTGIKVVEGVLTVNEYLSETVVKSAQEQKTIGNGALVISSGGNSTFMTTTTHGGGGRSFE